MKCHYILAIFSILLSPLWAADNFKVVCFFDSSKNPNISLSDLSNALDHCSHFVYGYATLVPHFFSISFDGTQERTIPPSDIGILKQEFPQVKFPILKYISHTLLKKYQ
uniref:Uncharacterized protein n=1 Tax=Musca domestica TaxID=7370 RepID=A0A1I8NIV0_MUSDO